MACLSSLYFLTGCLCAGDDVAGLFVPPLLPQPFDAARIATAAKGGKRGVTCGRRKGAFPASGGEHKPREEAPRYQKGPDRIHTALGPPSLSPSALPVYTV